MIDEKINKTLSELEASLKNIESARKQVQETINSYDGLQKTTTTYVNNLSSIDKNLEQLIYSIGKDYESKVVSFEKDCKIISDSCGALIDSINNSVEEIKNNVSTSITGVHKKFTYVLICNAILFVTIILLYFLHP